MSKASPVVLPCEIEMGGFSGERYFKINLVGGKVYESVASYLHFLNKSKQRLESSEPPAGESIEGFVVARIIGKTSGGTVVEIPDGEALLVPKSVLISRPREKDAHVPVGS